MENVIRKPSEEMPWLKWYVPNAREDALSSSEKITMWGCLENRMREQGDRYPALRYFGRNISRSRMIREVYRWARMLRGMGVEADDRVVMFTPFTPEAAYIMMALNHIGAWPLMLNTASSPEALKKAAEGAHVAIVADAVEESIACVVHDTEAFKHVVLLGMHDDMPFPLRQAVWLKAGRRYRRLLAENANYTSPAEAFRVWGMFDGRLDADWDDDRPAIITSSGGTSSKGYAKLIMDTNSAVTAMIRQADLTPMKDRYTEGGLVYTSLPPFVSTSVFVLFFAPLFYNMTCLIEPRLDAKIFTATVLKNRPAITLIPGRCWISFFTQVERLVAKGHTPDLSRFTMPVIGGEGVSPKDLRWMNGLLRKCGSGTGMTSGYGLSELFSMLTADCRTGYAADSDSKPVTSVGMPMPGAVVAVFDENGNELGYGERGEICVRATTMMRGYYGDEAHTEAVIRDGWLHTGDLGSIDEDGMVYVYCRLSDSFYGPDSNLVYPVDLELKMNEDPLVRASMVNNMAAPGNPPRLAVHLVLDHGCDDSQAVINRLDAAMEKMLPEGVHIEGYKIHRHIFRMSNVCKIDRNSYRSEMDGYVKPDGNVLKNVSFA